MKGYFTTHRGKTKLISEKQHRYMHQYHLDHTHYMPDGKTIRHRWTNDNEFKRDERKILGKSY